MPDGTGDQMTIRGRVPGETRDAARIFVEDRIWAVTPHLTILKPGVCLDERV